MEVGLHQRWALSPFLSAIEMNRLTDEVRQESPLTLMFLDDIVIYGESSPGRMDCLPGVELNQLLDLYQINHIIERVHANNIFDWRILFFALRETSHELCLTLQMKDCNYFKGVILFRYSSYPLFLIVVVHFLLQKITWLNINCSWNLLWWLSYLLWLF